VGSPSLGASNSSFVPSSLSGPAAPFRAGPSAAAAGLARAQRTYGGGTQDFQDIAYEPDRLLARRGPPLGVWIGGGLALAAVVTLVVVFSGSSAPPPDEPLGAEDVVARVIVAPDLGAEVGPGSSEGDSAETEVEDTGEQVAAGEGEDEDTPARGTSKKRRKSSEGGAHPQLRPKKKKKTKRQKRADVAKERDPGQVIYELGMLSAAKKALRANNPLQALAYADQHASEFPRTQFKEQRREIKIKALCKLGRKSQAKAVSQQSAKARRVYKQSCA
jgi:hypothetical protein